MRLFRMARPSRLQRVEDNGHESPLYLRAEPSSRKQPSPAPYPLKLRYSRHLAKAGPEQRVAAPRFRADVGACHGLEARSTSAPHGSALRGTHSTRRDVAVRAQMGRISLSRVPRWEPDRVAVESRPAVD